MNFYALFSVIRYSLKLYTVSPACFDYGAEFDALSNAFHQDGGRCILDSKTLLADNIHRPSGLLVYLLFCVTKFGWGFDKYKEEANTGKELKVYPWMKWYFLIVLPLMIISIFIIELIA